MSAMTLTSKIAVVGVRITILVVTIVPLGLRIIINDRSSRDLHCFACDDHIGNRCLLPHTVLSNVAPNNLSTLIFVLALITVKPIIKYLRKFKISEVIKPIMKCQRSKIYEVDYAQVSQTESYWWSGLKNLSHFPVWEYPYLSFVTDTTDGVCVKKLPSVNF